MELFKAFIDFFLHLDLHLTSILQAYGIWTYLILFLIIFCETGLVVTPFLPGDSLLFAVGALAAGGAIRIGWLIVLLTVAAVAGDGVNYWLGYYLGPRLFKNGRSRFLRKEHLDRTHRFYEKYGGKTIVIARFVPIVRTFAPFVAGLGRMDYWRFSSYNVVGGTVWIVGFTTAGYLFGNIPAVKSNFTLVIFAIIFISLLPGLIEFFRVRSRV
ncbi:MAG TPA: DedA family protein [Candidatus Manganitrophaceae bacterium]|nr:DedA family protein [Candidatus Manganitrophaceae bacterium]